MPNIPPKGLFGRAGPGVGAGTAALDVVATLVGETLPRNALEVWVGDAAGVPKLIWVRTPSGPTAATWSYVSGTPASTGLVRVVITPESPLKSGGYEIRRPDNSVAGVIGQGGSSFDDLAPRLLAGSYKVAAFADGVYGSAVTATGGPNLAAAPSSFTATVIGSPATSVHMTWVAPSFGRPHQYQLWRNGAIYTTLDGSVLSFDDPNPLYGDLAYYTLYPVVAGSVGAGINASTYPVAVPVKDPTVNWAQVSGMRDQIQVIANGVASRYTVESYDTGKSGFWELLYDGPSPPTLYYYPAFPTSSAYTVTYRVLAYSPGGNSNYVTKGPYPGSLRRPG